MFSEATSGRKVAAGFTRCSIVMVGGRTEPGALVAVNGEQVAVAADGAFTKTIQLANEGWAFVEIKARDGAGNETVRRRRVFLETL